MKQCLCLRERLLVRIFGFFVSVFPKWKFKKCIEKGDCETFSLALVVGFVQLDSLFQM